MGGVKHIGRRAYAFDKKGFCRLQASSPLLQGNFNAPVSGTSNFKFSMQLPDASPARRFFSSLAKAGGLQKQKSFSFSPPTRAIANEKMQPRPLGDEPQSKFNFKAEENNNFVALKSSSKKETHNNILIPSVLASSALISLRSIDAVGPEAYQAASNRLARIVRAIVVGKINSAAQSTLLRTGSDIYFQNLDTVGFHFTHSYIDAKLGDLRLLILAGSPADEENFARNIQGHTFVTTENKIKSVNKVSATLAPIHKASVNQENITLFLEGYKRSEWDQYSLSSRRGTIIPELWVVGAEYPEASFANSMDALTEGFQAAAKELNYPESGKINFAKISVEGEDLHNAVAASFHHKDIRTFLKLPPNAREFIFAAKEEQFKIHGLNNIPDGLYGWPPIQWEKISKEAGATNVGAGSIGLSTKLSYAESTLARTGGGGVFKLPSNELSYVDGTLSSGGAVSNFLKPLAYHEPQAVEGLEEGLGWMARHPRFATALEHGGKAVQWTRKSHILVPIALTAGVLALFGETAGTAKAAVKEKGIGPETLKGGGAMAYEGGNLLVMAPDIVRYGAAGFALAGKILPAVKIAAPLVEAGARFANPVGWIATAAIELGKGYKFAYDKVWGNISTPQRDNLSKTFGKNSKAYKALSTFDSTMDFLVPEKPLGEYYAGQIVDAASWTKDRLKENPALAVELVQQAASLPW